ncbi:MAG: hypothetical protein RQ833_05540 [Sphingomonadaceae bacterium]|nr:hypothetical protein [Sphingomonadaceae bacterium]
MGRAGCGFRSIASGLSATSSPVRGAVIGAIAASVDLSAERSGAATAAAIQAQFETIVDAMPGLLFVTAADGA